MYGKKYLKKSLQMDTSTVKDFKKKLKQVRKEMLAELPIFNDRAATEGWDYNKYEEEFNKRVNELIRDLIEIPVHENAFKLLDDNETFTLYISSKRP